MISVKLKTAYRKYLADTYTPVSIFLRLRDKFSHIFLLESTENASAENAYSFICFDPIASVSVTGVEYDIQSVFSESEKGEIQSGQVDSLLQNFFSSVKFESDNESDLPSHALYGYTAFNALQGFGKPYKIKDTGYYRDVPDIFYGVFRFVIAINHFKDEMYIFMHTPQDIRDNTSASIEHIEYLIRNKDFPAYKFKTEGSETPLYNESELRERIEMIKNSYLNADLFQILAAAQYSVPFSGDEFNVYRALRSENPSPYLFYFDFGGYKIMGSSPEAQMVVKSGKVRLTTTAGTAIIENDDSEAAAKKLLSDNTQVKQHEQLLAMALSRIRADVGNIRMAKVTSPIKFQGVVRLSTTIEGDLLSNKTYLDLMKSAFPVGQVCGMPIEKALEAISEFELSGRGYYGGCIGFVTAEGDFNHALLIRSIFSKDNRLYYHSGCSINNYSDTSEELKGLEIRLRSVRRAIKSAENII